MGQERTHLVLYWIQEMFYTFISHCEAFFFVVVDIFTNAYILRGLAGCWALVEVCALLSDIPVTSSSCPFHLLCLKAVFSGPQEK